MCEKNIQRFTYYRLRIKEIMKCFVLLALELKSGEKKNMDASMFVFC